MSIYETISWTRLAIAVSPTNANAVYYGTTKLYGDNDVTNPNFRDLSGYRVGTHGFHVDIHSLEFSPVDSNKLFCGNDGGVSLKTLPSTNTVNWQSRNNGLGVSTLWSFDDSDNNENYLLCGFQDNFTKRLLNNEWSKIVGGDGYGAQINDFNDNNAFFISNSSLYRYNYNTGQINAECTPIDPQRGISDNRVQNNDYRPWDSQGGVNRSWLTIDFEIKNDQKTGEMYWTFGEIYKRNIDKDIPLLNDKDNPDNLWTRQSNIFELGVLPDDNSFPSWRRQINRFEISEANSNYRYIIRPGNDLIGVEEHYNPSLKSFIYKDDNANGIYEELIRPGGNDEDFPLISDIVIDPTNPQRIFISYTSFIREYKVWYSEDAGITWHNLDANNNLPNVPVNAITYQKGTNDILYVGTDVGVYVKEGLNADWKKYGNFPNVNVQDLKINYCNNKLRVSTYGRGMWEGDILAYNKEFPEIVFNAGENVIWEADVKRGLRNSIRIKTGAQLTIKSELSMPRNSKIIVEPGGKLIIDGGKLTQNCDGLWQGIEVQGRGDHPNDENYQGTLKLINGVIIEHAIKAIVLGKVINSGGFNIHIKGGILNMDNSSLKDNIIGIDTYRNINRITVTNSNFSTSDYLYNTERNIRKYPAKFIAASFATDLYIYNNNFINEDEEVQIYSSERGIGIYALDSNIRVKNNSFEQLYSGVNVTSAVNNNVFIRSTNIFKNNINSISLYNSNFATILNTFRFSV